jgi:hypothetical protein
VEVPTSFRDIETRARGSPQRLIAELRIGNLRLAHNHHQLASDLISDQFLVWKSRTDDPKPAQAQRATSNDPTSTTNEHE